MIRFVMNARCALRCSSVLLIGLLVVPVSYASGSVDSDHGQQHYNFRGEEVDLAQWHPEYTSRCYFPGGDNPDSKATRIMERVLAYLRQEPEWSDYLLGTARGMGAIFCLDNRADDTRGYYDYGHNLIAVRESLPLHKKVIIFIHELRHIDNVSRGYCLSLDYDASEMVRVTYAVEADVQAVSALVAWRLKQRGMGEAWKAMNEFPRYADIARAFERAIAETHDESIAARAAFVQWYHSQWRIENYHHSCHTNYFDLLDETKRIQQYSRLPENYFDKLCVLPDGRNYKCHETREIRRHP